MSIKEKLYVNARFLTQKMTGVQRFALEISLMLQKEMGDQIVFLVPNNSRVDETIRQKFPLTIVGKHKGYLWEQIELPRYLQKKNNPLLINLCNAAPIFYRNKFCTIHDVAYLKFPKSYSKSFLAIYKFMVPRLIRSSRHIFTVSNFSKQEITSNYPKDVRGINISVVYNAVDNKFKYTPESNLKQRPYLLAVSSVNERKNLHRVLEAFIRLENMAKDTELYIIGDLKSGSFKTLKFDKYLANPKIRFLGRIDDQELIKYYSNAIGFIYPSLYEGFGIPPLEAQSCGCPVIVSNVTSLPEVCEDSALYCDPYSVESIKIAVVKLLSDETLRADLVQKGYQNVNRFSWQSSAAKVLEAIVDAHKKA